MLRTITASIIALVLAAAAASAQQAPDVRMERVRTTADSMQMYLLRGADTMHVGMLWDTLQVTEHAGRPPCAACTER